MSDEVVTEIDIDALQPNPLQPRGLILPETLSELVDSIREHGILEPLLIAKTPAGYQIIAGERRWRAAKISGLPKVPVVIRETTPQGMLEMAIVENVQRIDLNSLERAQAYDRLRSEFGLSNDDIARRVSKSGPYISNTIRLLSLPDAIKDALISGATTEGHARALSALEDEQLIVEAYKIVLSKNLSVRAAEELARKMKAKSNVIPKREPASYFNIHSDELDQISDNLKNKFENLGHKSKIGISQSKVQARITIIINGEKELTTKLLRSINSAISNIEHAE